MWLLARRNLGVRRGRTLLFLSGFALAVGVMIALLSVGEAIVEQARDKEQVGGGDVTLVPQGTDVDVLKLGGVTALFSVIPNARFLHRQLLSGPRFADDVVASSPAWVGRSVFLRSGTRVVQGIASATVPSLERAVGTSTLPADWHDSEGERRFAALTGPALYDEMDVWHRPDSAHPEVGRWGEWYYFNVRDPKSGRYAYVSFLVGGDVSRDRGRGMVAVQLGAPGTPPVRHAALVPVDSIGLPRERAGATFGPRARVRVEDGRYRIEADLRDERSGRALRVALSVVPEPRAYFPPVTVKGADGFESGYVVPAVLARATGTIEAGGERWNVEDALAYHDHNWGYWRDVHWDWGQVQSPDGKFALVYGAVHAPELESTGQGARIFALVSGADGFLGYLEPDAIHYAAEHAGPLMEGRGITVPGTIRFESANEEDTLSVRIRVGDVAASVPAGDPRETGAEPGAKRAFLQMRGHYVVSGRVGGRAIAFEAPGASETFVPLETRPAR
ncbi:MAG: hypothetical protein ACREOU_06895 [Candidatus Eiseniibacteriota bacterium]